tara:strand:- start:167 stop:550 length:384 start_codon:yes stop_codon:yes gene_type:complete
MSKPILFLIAAVLVVVIDSLYLNSIKGYFGKQISSVQKSPMKLDMTATVLAYVFIVFGINYFIIHKRASVSDAFLLGLVIYGIYEFTNKALFSKWTYTTVAIDTIWGGILFSLVTYLTYLAERTLKL